LVNYACKIIQDAEASEDIVQQLFVVFREKKDSFESDLNIKSYFYRSVHNKCLNELKHLKVKQSYKEDNEIQRNTEELNNDETNNEALKHRIQF